MITNELARAALCVAAVAYLLLLRPYPAQAADPNASFAVGDTLVSSDHRVSVESDTWPWTSIGRVNLVEGLRTKHCSGTLIGRRHVLTAAHCVFNNRVKAWVTPREIHFVAGQSRDGVFQGHSVGVDVVTDPNFRPAREEGASPTLIEPDMIARDWAIITLADELHLSPLPWHAFRNANLPLAGDGGEIALAGYPRDRPFLLSIQRGCSARTDVPRPGFLLHRCESKPGDSGSPILLLKDDVVLIGIHTGVVGPSQSGLGYRPGTGLGVSASAFEHAAQMALDKTP